VVIDLDRPLFTKGHHVFNPKCLMLKMVALLLLFPFAQGITSAAPPSDVWNVSEAIPLEPDGTWEVISYDHYYEAYGEVISQTPSPGTVHYGLPGPEITVVYDPQDGSGPITDTFVQILKDATPPQVDIELNADRDWIMNPGGTHNYVVEDGDALLFYWINVTATDAVSPNLEATATLNGEPIALEGAS
jgi:hypothetical protein